MKCYMESVPSEKPSRPSALSRLSSLLPQRRSLKLKPVIEGEEPHTVVVESGSETERIRNIYEEFVELLKKHGKSFTAFPPTSGKENLIWNAINIVYTNVPDPFRYVGLSNERYTKSYFDEQKAVDPNYPLKLQIIQRSSVEEGLGEEEGFWFIITADQIGFSHDKWNATKDIGEIIKNAQEKVAMYHGENTTSAGPEEFAILEQALIAFKKYYKTQKEKALPEFSQSSTAIEE